MEADVPAMTKAAAAAAVTETLERVATHHHTPAAASSSSSVAAFSSASASIPPDLSSSANALMSSLSLISEVRHNRTISSLIPPSSVVHPPGDVNHHGGGGGGVPLAATIAVPLLGAVFACALAWLILVILRRRKLQRMSDQHDASSSERNVGRGPSMAGLGLGMTAIPKAARRKLVGRPKSTQHRPPSPPPEPVARPQDPPLVTSTQNHSYNTGLDTWSTTDASSNRGSTLRGTSGEYYQPRFSGGSRSTTYADPPPPYSVPPAGPLVVTRTDQDTMRSPFEDPAYVVMDDEGEGIVTPRDPFSNAHESLVLSTPPASSTSETSTLPGGSTSARSSWRKSDGDAVG